MVRRTAFWIALLIALAAGMLSWTWWFSKPKTQPAVQPSQSPEAPPMPDSSAASALAPQQPLTKATEIFQRQPRASTEQLIAQLLDPAQSLKARRQAGRALARLGSEQAMQALKLALQEGPPQLKAAIAEGLGESPHPEARAALIDLLNGNDETAARGALRGFARRGDADAAEVLSNVLFNQQKSAALRTEAALALGEVSQPEALSALTRAAGEIGDETLLESILEGLGKRPFAESQDFFANYLKSSSLSSQAKVTALEALANSTGDAASFLLRYAGDNDPQVRAAAAWALSALDMETDIGAQVVGLLQNESSPQVRARLYQALSTQESYDLNTLIRLAQGESDPLARLAALSFLAGNCGLSASGELLEFFNQTAVPELKQTALKSGDLQRRLSAVMALQRAGTAEAREVLQQISHESSDQKIITAAQAALGMGLKPQ